MSEHDADAEAYIDLRLRRDGITVDAGERTRLIELVASAQSWVKQISFEETRYAEPTLTQRLT
jgi:hypothetical protein